MDSKQIPAKELTFIGYVVEIESINECGVAFVHHRDDKSIKFHVRTEYLEEIQAKQQSI